jgi:2-haloacid dehalogenase
MQAVNLPRDRVLGAIFDLGGVVIDWSPRRLYRKIFSGDELQVTEFLTRICTIEWNEIQDAGKPLDIATREKIAEFPEWENEIRAYYGRWIEMIGGSVQGTAAILRELKGEGIRLFALSNWSRATFPLVADQFPELSIFEHIFLSADFGYAKPDLRFFEAALSQIPLEIGNLIFIDDNARNTIAAETLKLRSIVFQNARQLRADLSKLGLLIG